MIEEFLSFECTAIDVEAATRKRALQSLSELLTQAHPELHAYNLLNNLQERERLGSTALGEGVAIPHCRAECTTIHAALIRLAQPIEYDAPDDRDVDLLLALVVPEDEESLHLTLLADLAKRFDDPERLAKLRAAESIAAIHAALIQPTDDGSSEPVTNSSQSQ